MNIQAVSNANFLKTNKTSFKGNFECDKKQINGVIERYERFPKQQELLKDYFQAIRYYALNAPENKTYKLDVSSNDKDSSYIDVSIDEIEDGKPVKKHASRVNVLIVNDSLSLKNDFENVTSETFKHNNRLGGSITGSPPDRFERLVNNISRELSWLSSDEFCIQVYADSNGLAKYSNIGQAGYGSIVLFDPKTKEIMAQSPLVYEKEGLENIKDNFSATLKAKIRYEALKEEIDDERVELSEGSEEDIIELFSISQKQYESIRNNLLKLADTIKQNKDDKKNHVIYLYSSHDKKVTPQTDAAKGAIEDTYLMLLEVEQEDGGISISKDSKQVVVKNTMYTPGYFGGCAYAATSETSEEEMYDTVFKDFVEKYSN